MPGGTSGPTMRSRRLAAAALSAPRTVGTADNIAHALDADEDAFRGVKIISMGGTLAWDEARRGVSQRPCAF